MKCQDSFVSTTNSFLLGTCMGQRYMYGAEVHVWGRGTCRGQRYMYGAEVHVWGRGSSKGVLWRTTAR